MTMENLTIKQKVHILWAKGYNPIHLFGNVYLVRHEPKHCSKIPLYLIRVFKETPLDKQ